MRSTVSPPVYAGAKNLGKPSAGCGVTRISRGGKKGQNCHKSKLLTPSHLSSSLSPLLQLDTTLTTHAEFSILPTSTPLLLPAASGRKGAGSEMTAPQPIPGTEQHQKKARSRSQTFAYNRLDADGNVHHLPPDAGPGLSRSANGGGGGAGGSGILSMLGLSPKSSTSNSTIIPFAVQSSSSTASSLPVVESPSSSSSYSSSSTGEDAPPEAVTPPLQLHPTISRSTLPAIEQLDEDVFDDDVLPTFAKDSGASSVAAVATTNPDPYRRIPFHMRSASVGGLSAERSTRRSSWSAADNGGPDSEAPPGSSASPSAVTNWLQSQEKSAASATSPTWAWYSQQRDSGFKDNHASNPIGLFRRLSVSSGPRRVSRISTP